VGGKEELSLKRGDTLLKKGAKRGDSFLPYQNRPHRPFEKRGGSPAFHPLKKDQEKCPEHER